MTDELPANLENLHPSIEAKRKASKQEK